MLYFTELNQTPVYFTDLNQTPVYYTELNQIPVYFNELNSSKKNDLKWLAIAQNLMQLLRPRKLILLLPLALGLMIHFYS